MRECSECPFPSLSVLCLDVIGGVNLQNGKRSSKDFWRFVQAIKMSGDLGVHGSVHQVH